MASEDLEKKFIDAVTECDHVCREGMQAKIADFLSHVNCVSLLDLILQNPRFSAQHISSLIPVIIEANELECIDAAPALLANIPPVARSDGDLPVLAFLASLILFLPSDYVVPSEFDLSQLLSLFMRNDPDKQTWRKYSDALMHYLHCGAIETSSDRDTVRRFLDLCSQPYADVFWLWSWNCRTSDETRDRALELLAQLDVTRAGTHCLLTRNLSESHQHFTTTGHAQQASDADLVMDSPINLPAPVAAETADKWESPILHVWHALSRWIAEMWQWKRKAQEPSTRGDIEMALRAPGTFEDT